MAFIPVKGIKDSRFTRIKSSKIFSEVLKGMGRLSTPIFQISSFNIT
jgi:hypothetical protein